MFQFRVLPLAVERVKELSVYQQASWYCYVYPVPGELKFAGGFIIALRDWGALKAVFFYINNL